MANEDIYATVQDQGAVLLRGFFALEPLARLREAARRCFEAVEAARAVPEHYRFTPQAHSVLLNALLDFGIESEAPLIAPLAAVGLDAIFSELLAGPWRCHLEHSWARKKFAPRNAPRPGYHIQD